MAYFIFQNKKIYYKITGKGEPLLLLHGNTVSSKMFTPILKQYARYFQVITLDFLGHGKSDRVQKFEKDFWFYHSKIVYACIKKLNLKPLIVIGTSGGALVAINLALEHPEQIKYLIADSFEGEYPLSSYIENLQEERERDKKKWLARLIWWYCHGRDWRTIVDLDTEVNLEFSKTGQSFFHRPISELKVPTLLTGSLKDEYCNYLDSIYLGLKEKNKRLELHLFENGSHPAILSNKKLFLELIKEKR